MEIRRASLKDLESILKINENVYSGLDYLHILLTEWFEDEERRNFVLDYEGEVIGFFSLVNYRSGDLLVFVEQALRIKSNFNGRGYTPVITKWILNFIKSSYPDKNAVLAGTACPVFPANYEGEKYR